ncbi:MAG: histidine phosphotransferase family protein [Rubritepida sp.]|nr:histidine phosphotransferase family protein [Rubritepida sp.]MCU0944388.1 histidine phosphotransferase family protein [Rubritepida sp.]
MDQVMVRQTTSTQLAALVAARVCHDLGSPLASLSALLPQAADPAAHAVVSEAAGELRTRLKLFAALFGACDELTWADVAALLAGAPMAHRVRFALPAGGAPLPPGLARLTLAALLLAAEALPRGGVVHATPTAPSGLALRCEGRQVDWSPTLLDLIAGGTIEAALAEGPRRLLAPWVMLLAAEEGQGVSIVLPAGAGEPALRIAPLE